MTRVADIFFPTEFSNAGGPLRPSIAAAAAQHGVTIIRMPVQNDVEVEHAISAFAAEPDGGLLLTAANPAPITEVIARLALYHHLPLMYGAAAVWVEGFLLSHGPDLSDLVRGASSYVDRILRGVKPSELRVAEAQQDTLPVIGVLAAETFASGGIAAFNQGLAETGYVDGRNVTVEYRSAGARLDQLALGG